VRFPDPCAASPGGQQARHSQVPDTRQPSHVVALLVIVW
jgi:hypothetical protein